MNAQALAQLRSQAGLTQAELAQRAHLVTAEGTPRRDRLCRIEGGRAEPRAVEVRAFARVLANALGRPYADVLLDLLPA